MLASVFGARGAEIRVVGPRGVRKVRVRIRASGRGKGEVLLGRWESEVETREESSDWDVEEIQATCCGGGAWRWRSAYIGCTSCLRVAWIE